MFVVQNREMLFFMGNSHKHQCTPPRAGWTGNTHLPVKRHLSILQRGGIFLFAKILRYAESTRKSTNPGSG